MSFLEQKDEILLFFSVSPKSSAVLGTGPCLRVNARMSAAVTSVSESRSLIASESLGAGAAARRGGRLGETAFSFGRGRFPFRLCTEGCRVSHARHQLTAFSPDNNFMRGRSFNPSRGGDNIGAQITCLSIRWRKLGPDAGPRDCSSHGRDRAAGCEPQRTGPRAVQGESLLQEELEVLVSAALGTLPCVSHALLTWWCYWCDGVCLPLPDFLPVTHRYLCSSSLYFFPPFLLLHHHLPVCVCAQALVVTHKATQSLKSCF